MSDSNIHHKRINTIIVGIVALGGIIVIRLFMLQVIQSSGYRERAERQYVTPAAGVFDRGSIYFTNKDGHTVAAATIQNGFKAAINPGQVKDAQAVFDAISAVVPVDQGSFFNSVNKKNDPYEEVAKRLTSTQAEALTAQKLPGLTLYRDKWRYYPGGQLAAKAIGFVSYKSDNTLVGNYGLEQYYNDTLSRSGGQFYVNFFAEIFANIQSSVFKNGATTGDIVTSIEPSVQAQLEQTVVDIRSRWSSEAVGGIIMDPHTGEIVAMAQVPTFDLNNYGAERDSGIYLNPFVQNVFEMGSIVKPLIVAAALDNNIVTPQTSYNDAGSVVVRDKTIYNFDKKGRGPGTTIQQVLNESLNTGMVFIQQRMGKPLFKEYMLDKYKLGQKTGIDLPGEVNGIVGGLNGDNDVNYSNAAFGQGIATTPINIVRGFSTLANGGYLVTPHLVTAIDLEDGTIKTLEYPKSEQILKPETVKTIGSMLIKVVDEGYHRGLKSYTVGAKTGTAQIARPGGGGYYTDRNLHSMIGFFPATKPKYVLYLYTYYPKGARYSIQTLGDSFFNMIQFLGSYYNIPPDR